MVRDFIQQGVTGTPGTGNFVLAGALTEWSALTVADNGLSFDCTIVETGLGKEHRSGCVYTHGTLALTRGTLVSSTTGSAISFTAAAVVMVAPGSAFANAVTGLVTNANHTGDATGSGALTVVKINGTLMSGLATGLLKNTTSTGVPSIAVAGTDYSVPAGAETLPNKTLTAPVINGYTEGSVTANTGTAYTIALGGTIQNLTLTGNCTYTFPAAAAGKSFLLIQKQDATGSRTVTWPAAVKWPGNTAPTLTATASKADLFGFTSDGTNWYGRAMGSNYL